MTYWLGVAFEAPAASVRSYPRPLATNKDSTRDSTKKSVLAEATGRSAT